MARASSNAQAQAFHARPPRHLRRIRRRAATVAAQVGDASVSSLLFALRRARDIGVRELQRT
ncbi:MAG: hypothetical protein AB9M60_16255 [Leptothrix sp. (in: b-proteobacteria)]